jgi:hypothetical protein
MCSILLWLPLTSSTHRGDCQEETVEPGVLPVLLLALRLEDSLRSVVAAVVAVVVSPL